MKKGFTLIEVVVSVTILMIGAVGVYVIFNRVISVPSRVSSKFTGAYLAQEGVEIIRNIRDTNWIEGEDWNNGLTVNCPTGCDCTTGCEADYTTGTNDPDAVLLRNYAEKRLRMHQNKFFGYTPGKPSPYTREIILTQPNANAMDVEVIVRWELKGEQKEFRVKERLYNWHQR